MKWFKLHSQNPHKIIIKIIKTMLKLIKIACKSCISIHFNNDVVAEQRVTGLKLQDCVACVKPGTEIRVNLAASIHEWRRILSWSENQGSQICMGYMGNGLSVCVGWDCWEMTALLMEWSGAAFMKVRRE
jgi:hypothetical protein